MDFQSRKQLYNRKCLSVRPCVCHKAKPFNSLKSSFFIIHLSSFIILHSSFNILHHSSFILHHSSFISRLLSFSAFLFFFGKHHLNSQFLFVCFDIEIIKYRLYPVVFFASIDPILRKLIPDSSNNDI